MLLVPCSIGDALDRLTILDLKRQRIADPDKRALAQAEHDAVWAVAGPHAGDAGSEFADLREVNAQLWDVEDALRAKERARDFGPEFVALARSVYALNDRRASLKARINALTHSLLVEVKSYGA